jgi:hypothetical protein
MQHHATLYISSTLDIALLPEEARTPGNDVLHEVYEDFLTVADARRLQETAARAPIEKPERILVIYAARIGSEAQNALLKLFEDPPERSRFLLLVPTITMLLPTVRSRLQIETPAAVTKALSTTGNDFLQATYKERMDIIERLHKAKDKMSMRTIVTDVGSYVSLHETSYAVTRATVGALEYRDLPGASLKMWLEYLALLLPIVNDSTEVVH